MIDAEAIKTFRVLAEAAGGLSRASVMRLLDEIERLSESQKRLLLAAKQAVVHRERPDMTLRELEAVIREMEHQ